MIYHLEIEARFCEVQGFLNGFPIYSLNATHPAIFSKPINAALIGKNNKLDLVVASIRPFDLEFEYSVNVCIKLYLPNQISGPDQGQVIHSEFHEKTPLLSIRFDNSLFDFSEVFKDAEQRDSKDEILDYAWKLRALLQEGDLSKLIPEFEFKLRDFAISYSVDLSWFIQQFEEYMNGNYFANTPKLGFLRDEIFVREWCEKRIWEIGIGPDFEPFMSTELNENGMEYVTKMFVGLVHGSYKVIR